MNTQLERRGIAWALATLVAFVSPASAKTRVVTTITDLADIAQSVGDGRVSAHSIAHGTQDPHYLQAKPSYLVALHRADLLVSVGMELEVGYLPLLLQGARNPAIMPGAPGFLDASIGIQKIEVPVGPVSRASGDVHPLGNPHYWLDPENGKVIAGEIAAALTGLDPAGAADYRKGLKAFDAQIDERMPGWAAKLTPFKGTKLITFHQEFDYLMQRFGLQLAGYVEDRPGIPPSAPHLADLIQQMRDQHIRVILTSPYYENEPAERIADAVGAKVLVLPTSVGGADGVDHYVDLIDHIVNALAGALGGGSR